MINNLNPLTLKIENKHILNITGTSSIFKHIRNNLLIYLSYCQEIIFLM